MTLSQPTWLILKRGFVAGETYFRDNDFDVTKDANIVVTHVVTPESYLPLVSVLRIDSNLRFE